MASRIGRHYKLATGSPSLAMDRMTQPYIDRSAMSARAVISTATIDRVGDVLVPMGCQTENYEKNPVVLWAHGLDGIGQPIGTSRSPDGSLDVTISDTDVQATCWFSRSLLEAAQIFELIDEGIVRATSVRETPIKTRMRHDPALGDLLIVDEWDLEEWSWCAVGMNPDAVAKTLSKNRLGGQPIAASILKSLTAVAPKLRRHGVGLPGMIKMRETDQLDFNPPNDPNSQSVGSGDDSGLNRTNRPYGSTAVESVHAALRGACRHIRDATGPLENPSVKEALQATHESLRQQIQALQNLHNDSYPDESELKDDEENDEADESMKAFLASDRIAASHIEGLSQQLNDMASARNLSSTQRSILRSVSKQFCTIVDESTRCRRDADESWE